MPQGHLLRLISDGFGPFCWARCVPKSDHGHILEPKCDQSAFRRLLADTYKFIGFGDIHVTKPYKFIGFGDIHGPKPYEIIGFGWA